MGTLINPLLEQWQSNQYMLYLSALAILVLTGFYFLFKGGDWLTDGASGLAKDLGMNPMVIGLTIVSMATSAPELFTCITAVLKGNPDLVVGNLVGSNLANIGLVLGFVLLFTPLKSAGALPFWQLCFLLSSSLVFTFICLHPSKNSSFSRMDGGICILLMAFFLYGLTRDARQKVASAEKLDEKKGETRTSRKLTQFLLGMTRISKNQETATAKWIGLLIAASVMLWAGSEILVEGSVGLAREIGLSDALIGLTLIAIGTSLPELSASYRLALRGEHAILLGNIVGSNIFNMLLVGGITGIVLPFSVPSQMLALEFPAMILITAILCIILKAKNNPSKPQGILLLIIYFAAIMSSYILQTT